MLLAYIDLLLYFRLYTQEFSYAFSYEMSADFGRPDLRSLSKQGPWKCDEHQGSY
jgi:hypothetical protein